MIVTCPQCQVKYRVPEEKVKPEGSLARCSRCGHVFTMGLKDGISAASGPESELSAESSAESSPEEAAYREQLNKKEAQQALPLFGRGRMRKAIFLLVLVCLLGGLGYMYWPRIMPWISLGSPQQQAGIALEQKDEASALAESVSLQDVRQYMVDNAHMGRILVIEGKAVNASESGKKKIRVAASLFDDHGRKVAEQDFLCGNTASLYQLQNMEQEELEDLLSAQAGVLANNSYLAPKQGVDFMTFFAQYPEDVAEFSLRVVQVQEGAENPQAQ